MFYHAFVGYMEHAFPHDELKPLSCEGEDTLGGYALTLVRNHVFLIRVIPFCSGNPAPYSGLSCCYHRLIPWTPWLYLVTVNASLILLNGLVKIFGLIL